MSRLKIIKDNEAGSMPKNGGNKNKKTGSDDDARIDAKDTYPVRIIVSAATPKQNGKTVGKRASAIPTNGATPFPPLNLAKRVYVWPNTAENPHKICTTPRSGICWR